MSRPPLLSSACSGYTQDGWKELASLYDAMVARIAKIGSASAERGGENGDEGIPVTAFVTFFERPPR